MQGAVTFHQASSATDSNDPETNMKLKTPLVLAAIAAATAALIGASGAAVAADPVVIGLITKTETNPFFVKMKEGADAAAKA